MSKYTWGVDGYGRAHICLRSDMIVLLSMFKSNSGRLGVLMLEDQEDDKDK